jgi:hypothetical protein
VRSSSTCLVLLIAGLASVVLSWLWPHMVSAEGNWSPEQAEQHAAAAAELHKLGCAMAPHEKHAPGEAHEHADPDQAAFDAAQQRYNESHAKLEAAISAPGRAASVFKWLGVACWAAGAGLYIFQRAQGN